MVRMYWASENSIKGVPKSSRRGLFCPFQNLLLQRVQVLKVQPSWTDLHWSDLTLFVPTQTLLLLLIQTISNLSYEFTMPPYTSHRQSLRSFISYSAFKKGYWACNDRPMAGGLSLCKAASILLVIQDDPDKMTWNIYWFHFISNVHRVLVYA